MYSWFFNNFTTVLTVKLPGILGINALRYAKGPQIQEKFAMAYWQPSATVAWKVCNFRRAPPLLACQKPKI